jgi:hypothetical protein
MGKSAQFALLLSEWRLGQCQAALACAASLMRLTRSPEKKRPALLEQIALFSYKKGFSLS